MAQRHQDRGLCLKHKWTRRITFLVLSEKCGKATSMYLISLSPYLNKKFNIMFVILQRESINSIRC